MTITETPADASPASKNGGPTDFSNQDQLRQHPPRFMTAVEAAAVSTLGLRTIRQAISDRKLRVCRRGRRTIIRLEDLENFLGGRSA